jgi:hypothetical protein
LFVCVWQVQSSIHQRKPKWCEPRNEGTFNTNLPNLSNKRILTEHQKVDTSAALNKKTTFSRIIFLQQKLKNDG